MIPPSVNDSIQWGLACLASWIFFKGILLAMAAVESVIFGVRRLVLWHYSKVRAAVVWCCGRLRRAWVWCLPRLGPLWSWCSSRRESAAQRARWVVFPVRRLGARPRRRHFL
jgi:hypothetical protein